jgi:hypothetical protein
MGALIGVGGVIVGSIGQSIIAARTSKYENKWAISEKKREHVERIWVTLEEIQDSYARSQSATLLYITSASESARELFVNAKPMPWATLEMLVNLYLPGLAEDVRAFHILGLEAGKAMLEEIQRTVKGNPDKKTSSDRIEGYSARVIQSSVSIRKKVLAESAKVEQQRQKLAK